MGQNVVDCRLQVKKVETGFGRQTEKGPERLVEHLVKEVETGFGRLAEIGVPQEENEENGPSRCPAHWIVTAPLGPNQN